MLPAGVGLWVHHPSTIIGHLHDVRALGFDYVILKLVDGSQPYYPTERRIVERDAASIRMPVVYWSYAYPANVDGEAEANAGELPATATDLIIDAEIEFERLPDAGDRIERLLHGIAEATGHRVTLHLSSFYAPSLHPHFPYIPAVRHCASWMPQAYWAPADWRSAANVVEIALAQGAQLCPPASGRSVVPTINDPSQLAALAAAGVRSCTVWAWDEDDARQVRSSGAAWAHAISEFRCSAPGVAGA